MAVMGARSKGGGTIRPSGGAASSGRAAVAVAVEELPVDVVETMLDVAVARSVAVVAAL